MEFEWSLNEFWMEFEWILNEIWTNFEQTLNEFSKIIKNDKMKTNMNTSLHEFRMQKHVFLKQLVKIWSI